MRRLQLQSSAHLRGHFRDSDTEVYRPAAIVNFDYMFDKEAKILGFERLFIL